MCIISLNDADAAAAGPFGEEENNEPSLSAGVSAGVPNEGDFAMIRTDTYNLCSLRCESSAASAVQLPVARKPNRVR